MNNISNSGYSSLFFLIRIVGRGVQAGSTLHVGHWMAYCTCPGWLWLWRNWWNEDWQGKPKYSEKTCPSATLSTTNPTCPDPGSNPGRRGRKQATNRLSYGAAYIRTIFKTGHPYGSITNTMDIIETEKTGKHLNTLERYHVYKISKERLRMNDTYTDIHNPIFETLRELNTR
jgi:hypothetical protein